MAERLNLGDFVEALSGIDPEKTVAFDFGYFVPGRFISWRGDYAQLALTYEPYMDVTVGNLLKAAVQSVGATFEGYKGGTYRMDERTKLWVANYGDANWTGISGVALHDHHAIISTVWCEDDL